MAFSHRFAINGNWIYPPDDYEEAPIPTVGYTLSRRNKRQGYQAFVFKWSLLSQEHMTGLWQAWLDVLATGDTRVQVTYIEKATGDLVTRYGTMHEPIVARRHTVFYDNTACRMSHISDTP
jgi:hypothetical protein